MTTKQLLAVGRTFIQKISSLGNLNAAIVGITPGQTATDVLRGALWDATKTQLWPLQLVTNNSGSACCCLIQDRLIVATKVETGSDFQKTMLTEFRLPPDPFSAAPTFVQQVTYGDVDSRFTELVKLQTGEVVSFTVQQTDMRVCASVRSVAGAWTSQGLFTLSPEKGNAHFFSCAAAPWATNEVWVFDIMDGGKGIAAGIFTLTGGKLTLKDSIPVFVPTGMPADWLVNGELPALIATTDFKRGQILLSYTNTQFEAGKDQQAFPVVIGIKPDRTWSGISKAPEVVVSIKNPCPIVSGDAGVALDYRAGPTSAVIVAGSVRIDTADGQFGWNQYRQEFVYTAPGAVAGTKGAVMLATIETLPPPNPEPGPTPDLTLGGSQMVSLSWSGADPTGSDTSKPGKCMLQFATSTAGPWSDMTSHWPVGVQGKEAVPASGKTIMVSGIFYRLRPV